MSAYHMQAARNVTGPPEIRHGKPKAATAFSVGALLARDGSTLIEFTGGTTVIGIVGVSLSGVKTGLPDGKGGYPFGTDIPYYVADDKTIFSALLSTGNKVHPPEAANLGVSYGVIKAASAHAAPTGTWMVDESETSSLIVTVVDYDIATNTVFFKFIESTLSH